VLAFLEIVRLVAAASRALASALAGRPHSIQRLDEPFTVLLAAFVERAEREGA
jgi:hypothetical protein